MLRFEEIHTEVLCREVEESLETHQILVMFFFFQYNNCDHHGISTLGMVGFWTWHMMGMSEKGKISTIWLFNIAMENGSFIDDFPMKTSIYQGFSMAMLNNQRVNGQNNHFTCF